jgi:hypothetical protein
MAHDIAKLLDISSSPLGQNATFSPKPKLLGEWLDLMSQRNGFYAFESALLVRPAANATAAEVSDAREWNKPECWLESYEFELPKLLFFAEDIFGNQFAIHEDVIVSFDSETGEFEEMASSVAKWAKLILKDYENLTGHSIAHDWQQKHGALKPGERLLPRIPFVLGGEYSLDNLRKWNDKKGMRALGFLATHIRDVPDGAEISFVLEE